MPSPGEIVARVVMGRRQAVGRLPQRLLPKRVALPVLSSAPLSSVAYATQEVLVVLAFGGLAYLYLAPWVAAAVTLVLALVVLGYRQLVQIYPSGGGEFHASARNLGQGYGLVAGAAMLVGLPVAMAVAASAAADNLVSAFPGLHEGRLVIAATLVAVVAFVNLRNLRAGPLSAIPVYVFVVAVLAMIAWGLIMTAVGSAPVAESAGIDVAAEVTDLTAIALVVLVLRAVATGSVLAGGTGTIAAGVPTFRKPRRKNAATTLGVMGILAAVMFAGITALALIADVRYVGDPCRLVGFPCEAEPQRTVLGQVAAAVFGDATVGFFVVQIATVLVLMLAANAALQGFPAFASALAIDGWLPRQLHHRGDRLAYGNGIIVVGIAAIVVVAAFDASVTALVPLYVVAAFLTFSLALAGMARYWARELRGPVRADERTSVWWWRSVSAAGAVVAAIVALVTAVAAFTAGAWLVVVAVPALAVVMRTINRHYANVEAELTADDRSASLLPSRIHAIVLVSRLHKPTMRALAYARSARPDLLEAITVSVDVGETRALTDEWDRREIPVPLKVLDSPYQEMTGPVLDYVRSIRRTSPRDLIVVYIPEYVLGHWWEQLLHNKSVLRLRGKLMFTPGVMVTSVPWQLQSSDRRGDQA